MEPADYQYETTKRGISVLRSWAAGDGDDLSVALHEAQGIIESDGGPERLLVGLLNASGWLLVQLEKQGYDIQDVLDRLESAVKPENRR